MNIGLSVAGSDSSCGAGVQADIKTFQSLGVFGLSAITSVTVQNTQKVYFVENVSPDVVRDQILCLFDDFSIDVIKIGMVSSCDIIFAIVEALRSLSIDLPPIILDPVMISNSGYSLLSFEAKKMLIAKLIPMSFVVTPNLFEAEVLVDRNILTVDDMKLAAKDIIKMGAKNVVIKGGHLSGSMAVDVAFDGYKFNVLKVNKIDTLNTHGTGCTFSSAIAAYMAYGHDFYNAFLNAKIYITGAISNSLDIGFGSGPINHFFDLYQRSGIIV